MEERSIEYLSKIQLDSLKGFGDKRYSQLKRNKLKSVLDLLRFFPRGFWDRSSIKNISEVNQNDSESEITVFGKIEKVSVFTTKTRLRITTLVIKDESGGLKAKLGNKEASQAFAKRHDCKNKKDRTKASYWSCRLPRYHKQLGLGTPASTYW